MANYSTATDASAIGVDCPDCGSNTGKTDDSGNAHCGECGQFSEALPSSDYCVRHGVDTSGPEFPQVCPLCEQERDMRAQERHHMTRDPRVEPY